VCPHAQAERQWRHELYDALLQAVIGAAGSLNLSYHPPRPQGQQVTHSYMICISSVLSLASPAASSYHTTRLAAAGDPLRMDLGHVFLSGVIGFELHKTRWLHGVICRAIRCGRRAAAGGPVCRQHDT